MQETPYEIYNNSIGVRISFIVADSGIKNERSLCITSYAAYLKQCDRKDGFRLRPGKGAGNEALVAWNMMPFEWQFKFESTFGDPNKAAKPNLLEKFYSRDPNAADVYANYPLLNNKNLKAEYIIEYTTNASVLNAVIALQAHVKSHRKKLGGSTNGTWPVIIEAIEGFRAKTGHTLKTPSIKRILANYKKEGYVSLISGKFCNQNTAKIKEGEPLQLLEELFKIHNNLDNEQVKDLYNVVASKLGWKTVTAETVGNYRSELDLYTYAGRRGETNFRNTMAMQNKRRPPAYPLYYWTLDGWDAELLYQMPKVNSDGYSSITYHNRLTVVVVLDPSCKYPIGFAIGTHETPALIKEALRNAANHTKELFGSRFKPLQLQTDNYAKKTLTPLYEALTKAYTPAKVKNAKAKVIEPYFKAINKRHCQVQPNWSGFGVTANKESQPNNDYLVKIRHSFPDQQGCANQIEHIINMERRAKLNTFMAKWEEMPADNRLALSDIEYLNLFGETTGFTNTLDPSGFNVTILGQKRSYDTFDVKFRELRNMHWVVKYDPADLHKILVVDAESQNGRLVKEINSTRFILTEKYEQPMSLVERQPGDAEALQLVSSFNKNLEQQIIDRGAKNMEALGEMFNRHPQLNDTLAKLLIVDSRGQHKDNKSESRLMQNANRLELKQNRKELKQENDEKSAQRDAYINSRINLDDFLN